MQNPFIVGEKIYLRPVEMEDVNNYVMWLNDEEVRQFLSRITPFNSIREKEWVENLYKDDKSIILGIVVKESDKLIGNIGIHGISIPNRHAVLGIFIGDKSCWSKGYGTEALNLMLAHGFDQLSLHRIYLSVMSFNPRAIRAYEKAGFVKEGVYREHIYRNGKYHDLYMMSVLENEWRQKNGVS